MSDINYGNDVRREWFERVFWSDVDRAHSAFQAFVDSYSAGTADSDDEVARRDWYAFRAGWNAGWIAGSNSKGWIRWFHDPASRVSGWDITEAGREAYWSGQRKYGNVS